MSDLDYMMRLKTVAAKVQQLGLEPDEFNALVAIGVLARNGACPWTGFNQSIIDTLPYLLEVECITIEDDRVSLTNTGREALGLNRVTAKV